MNTLKNDRLDAMILLSAHVLAEKNEADLMSVDTSNVHIPASVERRIRHMINKERRRNEYGVVYKAAKQAAAIILVICTAAFAFTMSVEAVREALWSTVIQWYEDYISITHVTYDNPPEIIEEKKEPAAIPDDWVREVLVDSQSMYYIQYSCNNEEILYFRQGVLGGFEDWIDNESSALEYITINGHEGTYIVLLDKGYGYLLWSDGCYSYLMDYDTSKVSREMAINIAESVK